jgi:glutaredoxin 3
MSFVGNISTTEKLWLKLIKGNRIVMFGKTYCQYTQRASALLDKYTHDYLLINLDLYPHASKVQQDLLKLTGASTVPRIFINEKSIGGCTELEELEKEGKLRTLLSD